MRDRAVNQEGVLVSRRRRRFTLDRHHPTDFAGRLSQKPISLLAGIVAVGTIVFSLYHRVLGNVYIERLHYVDSTTLIMVGALVLRAVTKLDRKGDLETSSMALIGALSFLFAYEAIYKWSFYFFPWQMPPEELREFVLQVAISLVVFAGFAQGAFGITGPSVIAACVFVAGWAFWLIVGFPQLWDGQRVYPSVIHLRLTPVVIYNLNRATKVALCLVYWFAYTGSGI
jgi:hypothetical protein